MPAVWGEDGFTVTERIGARPTLEINGMWGGFIGDGFKTVIPAEAHAKVSCRLVPDQESSAIGPMIEQFLRQIAPPTVEVTVNTLQHAPATVVPLDVPEMQAAASAYARGLRHRAGLQSRRRLHTHSDDSPGNTRHSNPFHGLRFA